MTCGDEKNLRQDLVKSAALQLSRLICEETADKYIYAREFAMDLQHTYKPDASNLTKQQEDEETCLIGERMSREIQETPSPVYRTKLFTLNESSNHE